MFRLLIVDDEEIIVNGLYEILKNLKNVDLDIYKAYSGEEAINWLRRTRMDIILTDIKMPEIDGIQLVNEIQLRWPSCKVIFLTGYENFNYIYSAIQYQNVGYILKSEDPDKVVSAVLDAIQELEKNTELEFFIQETKEQINIAKSLLQKELLLHLLHGNQSIVLNNEEFDKLEIPLKSEYPVILVVGEHIGNKNNMSYWEQVEYVYSIKQVIERKIWIKVASTIIIDDSNRFYMFIQPKDIGATVEQSHVEELFSNVVTFMKGTLELVQNTTVSEDEKSISFIMNGIPCEWDLLYTKFNKYTRILGDLDEIEANSVFIEEELDYYQQELEPKEKEIDYDSLNTLRLTKIHHQSIEWIATLFGRGQRATYFERLEEYVGIIRAIKSKNNSFAIEIYFKCAMGILSYINERSLNKFLAFKIGQNQLMRIDLHATWNDAVEYLFQISNAVFDIRSEEDSNRTDKLIFKINEYVKGNLKEELSLVKLSEQVYLNPSYLSRFYKQVTGENISDFIDRTRIEKAKALMKNGKFKINEISLQVGYDNPASFTRFFKKMTLCTPQEYYEKVILSNKSK